MGNWKPGWSLNDSRMAPGGMDVFHIIEFYTRSTLDCRKVATTWQLAQAYVENEEHLCHEWAKATYMWPAEG